MRHKAWSAATLIVGAAIGSSTLTACSSSDGSPATPLFSEYVALGDSYTAAPGVPPDAGSACGRSASNYPHLFATATAAVLTDVSCSGATITDLIDGQQARGEVLPPQLDAVTSTTDLVTVGIGGNDLDLIALAGDCVQRKPDCADKIKHVQETLAVLPGRIAAVVLRIKEKAPKARIVLVGYPTIIAASAPCDGLPVPKAVVTAAREINRQLDQAVATAATTAEVEVVELFKDTAGHGLCSKEPWIAGLDAQGAQALHPTVDEQQFVADQLEALLTR